ncbi:hypothetical protein FHX82_005611 [Amycolatopsis bartoniae]|uniref:Polyketide biosynthesis methyltransferase n=1 Tax=Amycolatopsis bartoniae TaxID=941986 RepID=A0A8H9J2Z4_9PSEU|nr:SAM-dependent methyltransferase [Amycolatopsis bartoniae]MBB2938533.1 hypothetical protein [Amycolatopsis bartoniae]TVT10326.1 polyketide biosynthesis methyltransferase [Amycolatopsis bartoniae]GHF70324.1 hypothetical protein GCM10017566_50120 [Amycolatopsis bartoniae]
MDRTSANGPVVAMSRELAQHLLEASTQEPHEGRLYDYYLGGVANYKMDRVFADRQISLLPDLVWAAKQNRAFLARALQFMITRGVRQFVDIGSGLPTQGNVHQLAERYAPGECTVIYIDHDPVASAHSYLLLEQAGELDRNFPINGDFLHYEQLWDAIADTGLVDPAKPVGLLLVALLHFVVKDEPAHEAVRFFRDQVASGSWMAISHASTEGMSEDTMQRFGTVMKNYDEATSSLRGRTRAEVRKFFGDWVELDPPGTVWLPEWTHPDLPQEAMVGDMDPSRALNVAALARKP